MWPKAIAQLIELLPHAARLLPMADKFFQSKNAGDDANRRAMEDLRGELGKVTTSHGALYRQLNDVSDKVALVGADAAVARAAVVGLEERMTVLEHRLDRVGFLLLVVAVLCVVIVGLLVVRMVRG